MTNPLKTLNHGLSEELNMLRDTTRQFVENELMPIADEVDASNDFPHHLWQKMGQVGLLGITVDERFGGSAMGYLAINCSETARKAKKKNIYPTSAPGRKSVH